MLWWLDINFVAGRKTVVEAIASNRTGFRQDYGSSTTFTLYYSWVISYQKDTGMILYQK